MGIGAAVDQRGALTEVETKGRELGRTPLRRIRTFKDHRLLLSGVLDKQPQVEVQVVLLMEYTIQNI